MLEYIVDSLKELGHKITYVDPEYIETDTGVKVKYDPKTNEFDAEWSSERDCAEGVIAYAKNYEMTLDCFQKTKKLIK